MLIKIIAMFIVTLVVEAVKAYKKEQARQKHLEELKEKRRDPLSFDEFDIKPF